MVEEISEGIHIHMKLISMDIHSKVKRVGEEDLNVTDETFCMI